LESLFFMSNPNGIEEAFGTLPALKPRLQAPTSHSGLQILHYRAHLLTMDTKSREFKTGMRMAPKEPKSVLGNFTFWAGVILAAIPILFCLHQAYAGNVKVPEFGATSLGVLIGMLTGFFVQETNEWDKHALSSAALVLVGGGVLGFMHWASPTGAHEIWFYPIGLLAGFGLGTVWDVVDPA
jgi:hypothetical protein